MFKKRFRERHNQIWPYSYGVKFVTLLPLQETDRQELSARLAQEQEATALARQEAEQERLQRVKQLEDMELKIR
jgi:hypothetical protein